MNKEELHKIAPNLSSISKKEIGFKVPANYFNSVEELVISEINLKNSLNKSSQEIFKTPTNYFEDIESITISKLKAEALNEKDTHNVPNNYFDSIEDAVFEKLNKKPSKVIQLKNNAKKVFIPLAIAASLLLMFTLTNNTEPVSFDSLATNDIENWIDEGNIELSNTTLANIYADVELEDSFLDTSISDDELFESIDLESIEQFMIKN
ncbi:hypothetical protein SAMN05444411_102202 [Lutibacter oricola]|uniref:Uncharacterized protein n=1 Tax=Lutibacter oricola TaxID=762486 RepID=A0A1H2WHM6_9FLAO|nr:hypothetical protein [Lutibacter oricola]SDW80045.1 hypothetical protein SAMN05444411_102202 [Lutibacter oricola]